MTEQNRDGFGQAGEPAPDVTSVFRAVPTGELETPGEQTLTGLEALRPGTALLVVKRGPNAGSRFQLDKELVSAGRHPESEIFLDDVTVSRRHAEFRQVDGGFQVSDVGSLNGTYVNREPIETSVLSNGDEVQIGKFRLVFLTADQTAEPGADQAASVPGTEDATGPSAS